jgi:hypothetical protein
VSATSALYVRLRGEFPQATHDQVLRAVLLAVRGARSIGVPRTDPIVATAARHELKLVLGLIPDRARTDPEPRESNDALED